FELVRDANIALDAGRTEDAARLAATVRELWSALGLTWLDDDEELDDEIRALVAGRDDARERKDWAEADRLRDELRARGSGLEHLAPTDAPQGVIALASPLPAADLDALYAADDAFLVAVDGVTDPRNLGAFMRSAETAGATGIIVGRHRAAHITPAVTKAAA